MMNFEYDKSAPDAQYYEVLGDLIERWEYEIVEFKEAKGNYNTDRALQLSAWRTNLSERI
ncbi:MAG: hypothetical protein LUG99_05275 [Lachnospiraceae bacterium]|nr:hypothetical protein [Lachnospiraceae bacterium]